MPTITERLTPTQYGNVRLVVQVANDETLTTDSLSVHADIQVFNTAGQILETDNPTPQATPTQLAAFLAWVNTNLAAYEAATGLTRLIEEGE
jgi:hypothetical protein